MATTVDYNVDDVIEKKSSGNDKVVGGLKVTAGTAFTSDAVRIGLQFVGSPFISLNGRLLMEIVESDGTTKAYERSFEDGQTQTTSPLAVRIFSLVIQAHATLEAQTIFDDLDTGGFVRQLRVIQQVSPTSFGAGSSMKITWQGGQQKGGNIIHEMGERSGITQALLYRHDFKTGARGRTSFELPFASVTV